MKKLTLILSIAFLIVISSVKAQETIGELIIYFEDLPATWSLTIDIDLIGTGWDCDHDLSTSYQGGDTTYNQNSQREFHPSDACWHYDGYNPPFALGLYTINIIEDDQPARWFKLDFRTSDLPPGAGEWDDQGFIYSWTDNDIWRYGDPTKTSVLYNTLYIWEELDDIVLDTTGLEPYPPSNLTYTNVGGNPKLEWDHPSLSDDYRTGYEVYRSYGASYSKIATNSPDDNDYIDTQVDLGKIDVVYYKVKAINGSAYSEWSNTLQIGEPSKQKINVVGQKLNEYKLYQNFPNPFNPRTTLNFSLKNDSYVTIKIFDVLGRQVETIVNGYYPAGIHTVSFDGEGVESGIYFYKIKAGEFSDVKKLVILK